MSFIGEGVTNKSDLDSPVEVDTSHDLETLLDLPKKQVNELVSVIVPIASWDKSWRNLLSDLQALPYGTEIIFSVSEKDQSFYDLPDSVNNLPDKRIKWVRSKSGRSNCLNTGADAATGAYLWFLHADSRFDEECYEKLDKAIKSKPDSLYYSKLNFLSDGSFLMRINEVASRLQSFLFGIVSGNQGICIKAEDFKKLGGFLNVTTGGEGYHFCRNAKSHGLKSVCTKGVIQKSTRRYSRQGWFATTLKSQYLWFKSVFARRNV